jgi:hypothetical protein
VKRYRTPRYALETNEMAQNILRHFHFSAFFPVDRGSHRQG